LQLFKKGRFRPATFYKKDRVEIVTPAQHKDRTLLTTFRLLDEDGGVKDNYWHVLNCHLQAGKQGGRRVRQILEGVSTAFKTAKNKLKGRLLISFDIYEMGTHMPIHKACVNFDF
jgi:hypothetical protein